MSWNHALLRPHGTWENPDPQLVRLSSTLDAAGYKTRLLMAGTYGLSLVPPGSPQATFEDGVAVAGDGEYRYRGTSSRNAGSMHRLTPADDGPDICLLPEEITEVY